MVPARRQYHFRPNAGTHTPTAGTDMSYCRYRHALSSVPTAATIGTSDAADGTGFPDRRYHFRYRWYRRSDSRYHTRYRRYRYLRELVPSSADYRYRWHRTFGTICSDSKYRKGRLPSGKNEPEWHSGAMLKPLLSWPDRRSGGADGDRRAQSFGNNLRVHHVDQRLCHSHVMSLLAQA